MGKKHDQIAVQIARKEGTKYNRGKGPDVNSPKRAIEVETENTVKDAFRQLQGFRKPVYIAGADPKTTKAALDATKNTSVGVMNSQGKILKPSSRKG